MESNMRKIMEQSWRDWHTTSDYVPAISPQFERGFISGVETLMPLLIEAYPHVLGSHGAAHLVDGFRPQRRPIDDLVDKIKEVLPR